MAARAPGELEAEALTALWAAQQSLAAAEARRELRNTPALYSGHGCISAAHQGSPTGFKVGWLDFGDLVP